MKFNSSSTKRDIINTSFYNTFFQLVVLIARIIQVPILLKFYGIGNYGGLLLIISISSYLTLFEFGFKNYAINESIKFYFEKKYEKFEKIYFHTTKFIVRTSLILIFLLLILALFSYKFVDFTNSLYWIISIFFLFISILLTNIMTFLSNYYRIINQQIKTFFVDTVTVFFPILILIIYALLKKDFDTFDIVNYSIINLISVLIIFAILLIKLNKLIDIKKYFYGKIDFKFIFEKLKKSIFFSVFTANTIIITHSITQIIAISLSTTDISIFNTTKMLTNLIIFFFGAFTFPFLADITRRNDDKNLLKDLSSIINLYHQVIFVILFISCLILFYYGEFIYSYWLNNKEIVFNHNLLKLLIISTILTVFNNCNSNILIATNNHIQFSIINIVPTIFYVLISFYFLEKYSLIGAAYSLICFEIINLFVINYLIFKKLDKTKNIFKRNLCIFLIIFTIYIYSKIILLFLILIFSIFLINNIFKLYFKK